MSLAGERLILAKIRAEKRLDKELEAQVMEVFKLLDPYDLDVTYPAFEAAMIQVITDKSGAFLTIEQAFLRAYCTVEYGLDVAVAKPAGKLIGWERYDQISKSVKTVTSSSIKAATAQARSIEKANIDAQTRVVNAAKRHVRAPSRSAAYETAKSNVGLGYYKRVTTGAENCDWCRMLEGRGAVYDAESGAGAWHDGCDCLCVPSESGPEAQYEAYLAQRGSKNLTDDEKEKVRAWLSRGPEEEAA